MREHKSVLDFGRDWRDWEVDIFRDDDVVSNATAETETGTATSIGVGIGIAVDEESVDDGGQTHTPASSSSTLRIHSTPSSSARRRTAPVHTLTEPRTPLQSRPQSQWQWHETTSSKAVSDGSPVCGGYSCYGAGCAATSHSNSSSAECVPATPESPVRFSYPNRRRPKTAPSVAESPLQGGSPRPPSEPGSLFSLARTSSGSRSPAPGVSSTHTTPNALGLYPPAPYAGSALLFPASAADAAQAQAQALLAPSAPAPAPVPGTVSAAGPATAAPTVPPPPLPLLFPSPPTASSARDLPPPIPQLRPRSHNPILISTSSSCADLKLSARADHARSQIITKLALHPLPPSLPPSSSNEFVEEAEWETDRQQQQQLQEDEDEDRRHQDLEQEDAVRWANEVARLEAETDRILAEQKRKDLARLQAQLAAVPDAPPRVRSPIVDKFAFFLRKGRRSDPTTLSKPSPTNFQPLPPDYRPASLMDPTRFIQAGGGGIVPQTDAPITASNAGERRVTIRCLQSSISLPVTPDTTPSDILYSAANLMTQNINPKTSIVVECYFAFGLERRLRRYERVRDVLNSWDRDSQHCLLIIPGDSVDNNPDLNIDVVPRSIDPPPGLVNFSLYHSSRPGKWNKRYITLMENGQVFSAKKKDAKLSDKDSVSLCHLSDFDLYSVTEKDMLKQIKAPKSNTLAVKSQQKSSVFQNTENFIHFFSTDDAKVAGEFKKVLHAWRSWYLANKKVDVSKTRKTQHGSGDKQSSKTTGLARSGTTHRHKVSVDETPYTIGTFSPLLDMDRFEKPIDDFGKDLLPEKQSARQADHPSGSKQHKVVSRSRTTPNLSSAHQVLKKHFDPFSRDKDFKAGGLLGRTYEGRKQQAERNAANAATEEYSPGNPFTGGHSLLNNYPEPERQMSGQTSGLPERRGTVRTSRSTAESTTQPRSRSRPPVSLAPTSSRPRTSDGPSQGKREMPQPLVDLTPRVPDLPAAWRDGHGRGVRAPNGTPLIQMATGWDNAPDATMAPQLPTVTRMATNKAYPPQRMASQSAATRPRSRSTAGNGGTPVRRVVSNEQPPIPSLPRRSSKENDEDVPLINFVDRERGRDAKPRASHGLGRSGTVRH
nr:uncharacterized protein CTRU02_07002 [Colletotrichum truncatum]KAF6791818.1 hypothetical protein CTRU02_07002 [Colletotrichum truncatum]